jgi:DNA-binding LacI/PurR family transcriptional regulator
MNSNARRHSQGRIAGGFAGDDVRADLYAFAQASTAHTRLRSVRDLASDYGVSHSTIKRVLDGLAEEGVVYAVRGRGCFVAETPTDTVHTVLYVDSPNFHHHVFWVRRLQGIMRQAESSNLRIQVMENTGLILDNTTFLREVSRKDVRGVVLPWLDQDIYDELKARNPGLRIVVLGEDCAVTDAHSVWIDEETAARAAVSHLARNGVKKIACFSHRRTFLAAAEEEGDDAFHSADVSTFQMTSATEEIDVAAALREGLEAFVFSDDRAAQRFIDAGLKLDVDFHDNFQIASLANAGEKVLPDSSLRLEFDGRDIGSTAVRLLDDLLSNETLPPISMRVMPRLIVPETNRSSS